MVYQVHSPVCVTVDEPWDDEGRPQADALVTDRPGLVLGILTADCAPVLLADRAAGVVGAAHAGWKGAIAGVTENTLAAMEALGAERSRIAAAVGPCIAQSSYEVDETFRDRFLADAAANHAFFVTGRPDHFQFDLSGYVANRLQSAGLGRIEQLAPGYLCPAGAVLFLQPLDPSRRGFVRSPDIAHRGRVTTANQSPKKAVGRADFPVYQAREVGSRLPSRRASIRCRGDTEPLTEFCLQAIPGPRGQQEQG